ncbi:hypothetical protein NQ314_014403, partial [Rhamnusium bicolor]
MRSSLTFVFRFFDKFNIGGTVGVINGTHVAIIAPPAGDNENLPAIYYNRKGFCSINVQILLGDSGYPLEPWLLVPIVDAPPGTQEARYTDLHCHVRNIVERCIGVLKMRFMCLTKSRTLMFQPLKAAKIIYASIVLHNIATKFRLEENGIFEEIGDFIADMNLQA